LPRTDIK